MIIIAIVEIDIKMFLRAWNPGKRTAFLCTHFSFLYNSLFSEKYNFYLSWDIFTITSYLIAHSTTKHFDTNIELSLGTLHDLLFVFFAWISKTFVTLETKNCQMKE